MLLSRKELKEKKDLELDLMVNLNYILECVINDAKLIGFPTTHLICNKVFIDKNVFDKVAECRHYYFKNIYEIHISEKTLSTNENNIKNIIAHEVLHANIMTQNHGYFWTMYCNKMKKIFGYNIKEKYR